MFVSGLFCKPILLFLFSIVVFELLRSHIFSISFSSGFSTYGSVMIYYGIHSFILVRMFIVKTICCNFYPLILLIYLSIKMLTDVTLFRMAPPTRQNPDRNEGSQANPPPPPPPPEAWQAIMAATNANAQMILQLLQERTQGQGNQGNQGQGNNQFHFATLNQFLANQPKSFSYCAEATDADDWLVDINKHFECSNVRPEDFVKFASFQLKDQAADWFQQYKDSRGGRVITWTDFCRDFKAHHIPQSVVESKREEFRNLKQGNMSVYQYNIQFQKLARFAKQDVPDEKSMIY